MQSMTGYGRGLICEDGREMTVEVKSVNHRFLDVSFRLARPIAFLDDAVRTGIAARLARGHVDVFVNYVNHREDAHRVHVDTQLARTYQQAAGELSDALGVKNDLPLSEYIHMPDVLTVEASEEDQDAVRDLFMRALNLALDGLIAMRAREGDSLRSDMMTKLDAIDALRSQIATRAPLVVEEYRTKLNQRLSALLGGFTLQTLRPLAVALRRALVMPGQCPRFLRVVGFLRGTALAAVQQPVLSGVVLRFRRDRRQFRKNSFQFVLHKLSPSL